MLKLKKLFDKVIYESVIKPIILNEIDWGKDFSDVKQSCINPTEVVDYLNRVRANASKKTKDREKFSAKYPYIHAKSSFFKDNEDGIDIDHFIKKMTTRPNNVINTNEKILKSGGLHEYVYKTGIPAFRGIVYDISNSKFHYINYPEKYEQQLYNELKAKCKEHSAFEGYKSRVILRWNDSGDFFGKRYSDMAEQVMERLKSEGFNVASYAYTKSADVAQNSKLDTTFSSGANKRETGKMVDKSHKESLVVPKKLFKDLNLMKISDEQTLKDRVSKAFNIPIETLITYDELISTPKGNEQKWSVLVTPNDGDDAAFRPDVKKILLTQH